MQEGIMRDLALRHAWLCSGTHYVYVYDTQVYTREIFLMIVMMKKISNFDFILTQIELFFFVHLRF